MVVIDEIAPGVYRLSLYVPDIDQSLDEQRAKREFWQAFRVLGDWHEIGRASCRERV